MLSTHQLRQPQQRHRLRPLRLALFGFAASSALVLTGCSTWNPWAGASGNADSPERTEALSHADAAETLQGGPAADRADRADLEEGTASAEAAEASASTASSDAPDVIASPKKTSWTDRLAFWRSADEDAGPARPAPAFPRDDSVSYAKNVLDLFALERIADRPFDPTLPADIGADVPFIPQAAEGDPLSAPTPSSTSVLGVSLPTGWGKSLKDAVMPSSPEELKSRLMGFVDAKAYPDRQAAQKAFAQQVSDAMVRALTDEGFEAVRVDPPVRGTYTVEGYTWTAVTFADPARGCPKPTETAAAKSAVTASLRPEAERCRIVFTVTDRTAEEEPVRAATPWLGLTPEASPDGLWLFRTTNLMVSLTDEAREGLKVELAPIFRGMVKNLPAGTHLYAAPVRTPAGWLEPYVIEPRGTHRFRSSQQ